MTGNAMTHVIVVIGAGQIGQAIARRVGVGKHVVLADRSEANAHAAAEVMSNAGYEASVATVDVSSREAVHALVEKATGIGGSRWPHPRRRSVSQSSVARNDLSCGSLRHGSGARGVR